MIFKLEELTPSVYSEESRDFQLLCYTLNFLYNHEKVKTDSILNILDSKYIKHDLIQPLLYKLGFFLNEDILDDQLRYIAQVFPYILKYKGTITAYKYTIATILKLYDPNATFTIEKVNGSFQLSNISLNSNSLLIEIESSLKQINAFKKILEYISVPGISTYLVIKQSIADSTRFLYDDYVDIIYQSKNIASRLLKSNALSSFEIQNITVDTYQELTLLDTSTLSDGYIVKVNKDETYGNLINYFVLQTEDNSKIWKCLRNNLLKNHISAVNAYYFNNAAINTATDNKFLGFTNDTLLTDSSLYTYLYIDNEHNTLLVDNNNKLLISIEAADGDIIYNVTNNSNLYFYDNAWHKFTYKDLYNSLPSIDNFQEYDVIGLSIDGKSNLNDIKGYYRYDKYNNSWIKMNQIQSFKSTYKINDCIINKTTKKYYDGETWQDLNTYLGNYSKAISATTANDFIYVDDIVYYINLPDKGWTIVPILYYIDQQTIKDEA